MIQYPIEIVQLILGFALLILLIILIYKKEIKLNARYILFGLFITQLITFTIILTLYMTIETKSNIFLKIGILFECLIFSYISIYEILKNKSKLANYKRQQLILEETNKEQQIKLAEIKNNKLCKTDLVSALKLLENTLNKEGDWVNFKNKFQELEPDFLTNLYQKHSNLSKNEVRLLILVKIGFTQKEISTMLYIEEGSVKKSKQRVRKKMGVNPKITLGNYLLNF